MSGRWTATALCALLAAGCGGGGSTTTDDGAVTADDAGSDVHPDVPTDGPADVPAEVPADGAADVPGDVPADVPADAPGDTCATVDPDAHVNGAWAVTSLEVVRPDVFSGIIPSLDERITLDDIYVVLASPDLGVDATTFTLEVGQAIEYLSPPRARFCTDALCGYAPNLVTTFGATVDTCNRFATSMPADLTFSLYPPPHPGAAKPLTIHEAAIYGAFDPQRAGITDGVVTGAISASEAGTTYPESGTSVGGLLSAAGVAQDWDANGDGVMDGWRVELHFTGTWTEFVR